MGGFGVDGGWWVIFCSFGEALLAFEAVYEVLFGLYVSEVPGRRG